VQGGRGLGQRNGVEAGAELVVEPAYLFDAFAPILDNTEDSTTIPGVSPTQGVLEQRWLSSKAFARVYRRLSPRQRIEGQLVRTNREPLTGPGLDSESEMGFVRYSWNPSPVLGIGTAYRHQNIRQQDELGQEHPLVSDAVDVSVSYSRALSPRRRIVLTSGGGLTRAPEHQSGDESFLLPTIFGSARLDLTRSWSLQGDVRRDVSVLEGLALDPFTAVAFSMRSEATVLERWQLAVSGSHSYGGSPSSTSSSSFVTSVALAQVQFAVARSCALFASYSYYKHQLQEVTLEQPALPQHYVLNSIRFGVSLWLPILGRF
jgi:hypothetical protein